MGFIFFRYYLLPGTHGGMIGVSWGTFTCISANGQWRPMAPAAGAAATLTIIFVVYDDLAVLRISFQFTGNHAWSALETALSAATAAVNFAPMLSVHALQMDSVNRFPQRWAKSSFHRCEYATMLQTMLPCQE